MIKYKSEHLNEISVDVVVYLLSVSWRLNQALICLKYS